MLNDMGLQLTRRQFQIRLTRQLNAAITDSMGALSISLVEGESMFC